MKKVGIFTLLLIILLALVLRIYRVTTNPPHLYWDEASIAYNAYSINQTGDDEWGGRNPFLFKSFGDYKLPLYIYLTAFSQRIFGVTDFAVRAPSILAGTLLVVVIFFLVREQMYLTKSRHKQLIALCASFFLAISPWALQFSRAGFEANVALFCQTAGIFFFLFALRSKKFWLLFLSFFFAAASIYAYHSAVITFPLIFILLSILFRRELLGNFRKILLQLVFLIVLIAPYFPSYFASVQGRARMAGEFFTNMPGNSMTNLANNYVANFSLDYLFFHGDQDGRHSVKKLGELYLWQFPAVLAGAYFLLRYRSKASAIIFGWIIIGSIPPALTVVSPHALRGLLALGPWQILAAFGFIFILEKIKPVLRYMTIPIVVFALLLYLHVYYVHYPVAYAADWQDGEKQAITFVKKIEANYDNVFVYKTFDPIYILLYWPIEPRDLIKSGHNLTRMGKIHYFDYESLPTRGSKSLLLVPAWFKYDEDKLLRQINMTGGEPAYKIYEL